MKGYQQTFKTHAFGYIVDQGLDIPEPKLGVGLSEVLGPIRIGQNMKSLPYQGINMKYMQTMQDVSNVGEGKQFDVSEFPTLRWKGDALNGF